MDNFSKYQSKIKLYAKLQEHICTLRSSSTEEEINQLFKKIPLTFFDERENLIMLCQFFAMFGRYDRQMGRIVIKLFEKIMNYIKRDLQNESSLIWEIFGSCFYFKYWMYKEGLIDIEQIIHSAYTEEYSLAAEYFLPEIIEYDPIFFYNEIKPKFLCFSSEISYSKQTIENLKILREKHLKWLKESNNYKDEMYKEIEKNPIRLAIKTDDAITFQSLLSKSNLSVNSLVKESIIEHFLRVPIEMHYLEYAAQYGAIHVFNFLLLNDAKIEPRITNFIVHWDNYDMIHAVESQLHISFMINGMLFAVESWNTEFTNYVIEEYDFKYLMNDGEEEEEEANDNEDKLDGKSANRNEESKEERDGKSTNRSEESKEERDGKSASRSEESKEELGDKSTNKNEKNEKERNSKFKAKNRKRKEDDDDDDDDNSTSKSERSEYDDDDDESTSEREKNESSQKDSKKSQKKRRRDDYDMHQMLQIFDVAIHCYNMMFLNSNFIPFLMRNKHIVMVLFNHFMKFAFQDMSSFTADLILNFPGLNSDLLLKKYEDFLLVNAIGANNSRVLEKLLNNKNIKADINELSIFACLNMANLKIIEILSHHKDFDINYRNKNKKFTVVHISLANGNYFALKYFLNNFQNIEATDFEFEILIAMNEKHFSTLKCLIEYFMNKFDEKKFNELIAGYKNHYKEQGADNSIILMLDKQIKEIKSNKK